jgi:hypothetical protein
MRNMTITSFPGITNPYAPLSNPSVTPPVTNPARLHDDHDARDAILLHMLFSVVYHHIGTYYDDMCVFYFLTL